MKQLKFKGKVCGGSGKPPVRQHLQVGICCECGVRTFLDGDLIQTHKASSTDTSEYVRGRVSNARLAGHLVSA